MMNTTDPDVWVGNFNLREFSSKDGQPSPYPQVVKQALLDLCNEIRVAFGKPILVNSGYRSPEHNAAVGGVKNSYHVQGLAADLRPKDLKDLPRLRQIADRINVFGGVGFYDTFVHVDARGKRARWDYRSKK
jgi:uncharacterized protein YcbK (DUF882 family)